MSNFIQSKYGYFVNLDRIYKAAVVNTERDTFDVRVYLVKGDFVLMEQFNTLEEAELYLGGICNNGGTNG